MSPDINNRKELTADFGSILPKLIAKWYIFLFVSVLAVSFSYVYTKLFITPKYDSTAKIYIMNTGADVISPSEISISSYLTKDYEEIIVDRAVLEDVINQMDLKMSYSALKSSIKINNPVNTRIIEITVRTEDPATSKQIADCICTVSQEKIVKLMNVDRVNIISNGSLSKFPSYPSQRKNMLNGFIIGIVISLGIVTIMYFRDDKIKTAGDIEEYLKIGVLGVVPYNRSRGVRNKYI